ncbi:hypothetical protein [Saccharicrinis aurantiacus]|uniref:hypothetical protein n=1 Tax=Saccharicrinis aurantiacus TaxID=1849719 RepID=UPI002492586D|nr:hypothetical protein [Saccharicrinis aurantiacus]
MAFLELTHPKVGNISTQEIKYTPRDKVIIVIVKIKAVVDHLNKTNGSLRYYKVIAATKFPEAYILLKKYVGKNRISELIIRSHGSKKGSIKLDPKQSTYDITASELANYNTGIMINSHKRRYDRYKELEDAASLIKTGGNLIFTACEAGNNDQLLPELAKFIKGSISIYVNMGTSSILSGKNKFASEMPGLTAEERLKPETIYVKEGSIKGQKNNLWFERIQGGNALKLEPLDMLGESSGISKPNKQLKVKIDDLKIIDKP